MQLITDCDGFSVTTKDGKRQDAKIIVWTCNGVYMLDKIDLSNAVEVENVVIPFTDGNFDLKPENEIKTYKI